MRINNLTGLHESLAAHRETCCVAARYRTKSQIILFRLYGSVKNGSTDKTCTMHVPGQDRRHGTAILE